MKEAFDDEKFYTEEQDFGSIGAVNCKEVMAKYSYDRYVQRFRLLASAHRLKPEQRPKLDADQYAALMKKLEDALLSSGERNFLKNEKTVKVASRLLIWSLFNEDYCGMGATNWIMGREGYF